MKLVRFRTAEGALRCGRLSGPDRVDLLRGDLFGPLEFDAAALPLGPLHFPIDPPNIFAIGRNYRAHAAETGASVPESPLIFMKPTTALCAPGAPIVIPAAAPHEVDYEAELAIILRSPPPRDVEPADALRYVLGFTCANDVSARDCQRSDKQWSRAKGFDTFCPLGPCVVPPEAIDPDRCAIRSRLNGHVMQASSTANMIHSCAALVCYLARQFTLLPGTLILTGTPEGVGMARTPPVFLKPGDVIEVEIDGIGVLQNPVVAAA